MRRYLLLLLALSYCACATSRSSESETHAAVTVQQDTSLARNETRTVTQGPETVTTVVEEWESLGDSAEEPQRRKGRSTAVAGVASSSLPQRAALIKRTTVIDVRGPVVAQTALQATAATETKAAAQTEAQAESKRSMRPAGLFGLWWLLPMALVALGWFKRDLLLGLVKKVLS